MSNKLEKYEIQFQPEQEFTLKISKNEILNLENNNQNDSHGINNNKYSFNINRNNNMENNDINNYSYNFSNLSDKLKKYYTLNNNNKNNNDFIKVNLNNYNIIKRREKGKDNNKTPNNNHTYSKMNDYWEKREKKNKKKMEKIKKEREKKLYGNVYQKPKISKNSEDIINRIKENINNQILEEEQIEDQINRNIPVKTKQRELYFKNNYNTNIDYYPNPDSQKMGKNNSIIDPKDSYVRLMKLKKYHKRTKTPKPKNINSLIRKKIPNNYKKVEKKLSINEIKSLEKIGRLRKEEENERFKKLQIKMNKESSGYKKDFNEININEEKAYKQLINISRNIHLNPQKGISIDSLNKNIKIISEKIKKKRNKIQNSLSINNKNNLTLKLNTSKLENKMSEMMKQRRFLNEIYNIDKRIINHSYIQSSSNKNSPNNTNKSNQKKNKILDNNKINNMNSFPNLSKLNSYLSQNKKNKNKNKRKINLYDKKSKNLKYKHFTDIKTLPNSTTNSNNSLKYYNFIKNKIKFNNKNKFSILNKNFEINNNNKEKYKSLNNLNNPYMNNYFNKSININEGIINNNFLYGHNRTHNNIINKNNENYPKYNLNNDQYSSIILQNESIDKIFKEIDNKSLLEYRKENENNLNELNKNKHKHRFNKRVLGSNLINQIEETKNYSQFDEIISRSIDNQKVKNILFNEKQKIENNLDYYNKELKLNKKKKEMILGEMHGKKINKNYNNINNGINEIQFGQNNYNYNYKQEEINKSQKQYFFGNELDNNIIGTFNFQRKHKF